MPRTIFACVLLLLSGCYSADQLDALGVGGGPVGAEDPSNPGTAPGDPGGDDDPLDPNTPFEAETGLEDDYDWSQVDEPELADGAHVPADEPCVEQVDSSHESLEVVIWTSCDVDYGPGDVIVGAENGGYLREIVSVTEEDGRLVLVTQQARLSQVMVNGGFDVAIPWENEERDTWDFAGTELYSGTYNGANITVTLTRGRVLFEPDMRLSAKFSWFQLKRAQARLDVDFEMDAEVTVTVDGGFEYGGDVPLGTFKRPFSFMAGPVPVAGEIEIDLAAAWAVAAEAQVSASAGAEIVAQSRMRGSYNQGTWSYGKSNNFSADPRGPDLGVEGAFETTLTLKTNAQVMLYGVAGPDFDVDPYARVNAELECADIPWELHGGVDLGVGLNLDIYVYELNKDFGPWNWETKIADGVLDLPTGIGLGTDCGECAPSGTISCGQIVSGNTLTDPEATSGMPGYDINVGNYEAPEIVYEWAGGGGEVEFRFVDPRPSEVNHDIMILDGASGTCHGAHSVAWGFNSVRFTPEGSGPYYIVVDGYDGDAGAFQLELDCNPD